MEYGYNYSFPALRGVQAGQEFFVAICPLKLLPKLFLFDEIELPAELRAQRTLNAARIPEIAQYLIQNPDSYVFSAITASIDGEIQFEPIQGTGTSTCFGNLIVSMSARFVINDGQHRRAAIEAALEEQPELGHDTIAVVFFRDTGLHRSQQLFADLNKHAARPTQSLAVLYDHRDPLACLARNLVETVTWFSGFTEKEKTSISNRSVKLFTLSGIYQATGALLGKKRNDAIDPSEAELAIRFWHLVGTSIREWQLAVKGQISSAEVRKEYINTHSVILHALGIAGRSLLQAYPNDWEARLDTLGDVDWTRKNTLWEGRAMSGGQINKSRKNVQLTAIHLKRVLGLNLTRSEEQAEDDFSHVQSPEL